MYKRQIQHQEIGFKLSDMAVECEAGRHLVYHAAMLKDAGKPYGREASMCKLFGSEIGTRCADRAIQVKTEKALQPLTVAGAFLKLVEREGADLVLLGKQAIDDDNSQTAPMLAALWGRPQATFASRVVLEDGKAAVTREVDAGLETIEVDLPAVISADLRLNEPRFVKLPDIMKAKRKPLDVVTLDELGVAAAGDLDVSRFEPPKPRQKGIMVEDSAQLVAELKNRGLL